MWCVRDSFTGQGADRFPSLDAGRPGGLKGACVWIQAVWNAIEKGGGAVKFRHGPGFAPGYSKSTLKEA